jgi:hypothetical protein
MNVKEGCTVAATVALVLVVASMVVMFVIAIMDPSVDDEKVFAIIGPAFQTIVGGFIGLITGIKVGEAGADK